MRMHVMKDADYKVSKHGMTSQILFKSSRCFLLHVQAILIELAREQCFGQLAMSEQRW